MNDTPKNKLINKIKNSKKIQIFLVVLIALIIVLTMFFSDNKDDKKPVLSVEESYVLSLENRLSNALSEVDGVGQVTVVITIESGMETILATKTVTEETSSGKKTETTPILVNGKTVVLREDYPKITGVLIVAKGANNISVINKIHQATKSLLNIDTNKIEILTMK